MYLEAFSGLPIDLVVAADVQQRDPVFDPVELEQNAVLVGQAQGIDTSQLAAELMGAQTRFEWVPLKPIDDSREAGA